MICLDCISLIDSTLEVERLGAIEQMSISIFLNVVTDYNFTLHFSDIQHVLDGYEIYKQVLVIHSPIYDIEAIRWVDDCHWNCNVKQEGFA